MVAFANPIAGLIHPKGWARPAGNNEPVVTSTFLDHVNRVPSAGGGIDIGTGRCGDAILAMDGGKVSLAGFLGTALVVRIDHGNGYESGYAHLATKTVSVGQSVIRGQVIGTLGKSGASACHLHGGMKLRGVEIDWWPLLIQNGATEDDVLQGANPVAVHNKLGRVLGDNTRFRSSPFVKPDNILAEFDTGAEFAPHYIVDGTSALGTNRWYGAWGNVGTGKQFGYVNVNALSSLQPIEQSGHSDQDLMKAAQLASYNAANDVSAVGKTELDKAAAKYPKP